MKQRAWREEESDKQTWQNSICSNQQTLSNVFPASNLSTHIHSPFISHFAPQVFHVAIPPSFSLMYSLRYPLSGLLSTVPLAFYVVFLSLYFAVPSPLTVALK